MLASKPQNDALAKSVRGILVRTLRGERVPSDVAEDLAHDLVFGLVRRIEAGLVADESVRAYVRRAAVNRARDYYRQQSGVFERARLRDADADADEIAATDDDAERRLVRIEEEREGKLRIEALRRVLDMAPPRYRDVLTTVYLEEQPIEVLVRRELQRRAESACGRDDALATKRARASVDKVLERARTWVRENFGALRLVCSAKTGDRSTIATSSACQCGAATRRARTSSRLVHGC